ncbi:MULTISPECIES: zf-HC2 domain-containing protein [Pontibacillus]|uniref:Anti-sigma-W factor RsiW n=1 Tax=Pontibacillus chungwhensis TaxID=265426 RepID=A0ABY8UY47_9BACI|nr:MULTISPECIES: zf-HC2 domain-containing protein [Pontibacillus]MCD5325467.1 zf-HC2 domain-containing protein [Pontibacillus sp. HN14]WIF98580.1 zf-HC2 domain-containing protein [Pontibacillus chungwhensis]
MKHIETTQLEAYVLDQLGENERMAIEEHLDTCDSCFEAYMTELESWTLEPSLADDFTDQTIDQIIEKQVMPTVEVKRTSVQKQKRTLMHYGLAAGLTLVLMVSGAFEQVIHVFDEDTFKERPSISKNIVSETDRLLQKVNEEMGSDVDE